MATFAWARGRSFLSRMFSGREEQNLSAKNDQSRSTSRHNKTMQSSQQFLRAVKDGGIWLS